MSTAGAWFALPDARLCANPDYALIALSDLPEGERTALAGLDRDPALHSVLLPGNPSLTVKAVCRSTAELIDSLRVEGRISRSRYPQTDDELNRIIAQLVLDSVLMVRTERGLITGAEAAPLFAPAPVAADDGNVPARLSLGALRYAEALAADTPAEFSAALYFYHRLPASPAWRQLISSPAEGLRYLGITAGEALRRDLDRTWRLVPGPPGSAGWALFRARQRQQGPARHKLYVSPRPEYLPQALAAATPVLARHRVPGLKVGADVHGILRPDKFVVYLHSAAQADDVAADLLDRLADIPAHAVPFTAAVRADGLLCRGLDPPRAERLLPWQGTSWRRWITDRLASYLFQARNAGHSGTPIARIALDRLELEGVNTSTWTPDRLAWAGPPTTA